MSGVGVGRLDTQEKSQSLEYLEHVDEDGIRVVDVMRDVAGSDAWWK